SLICARNLFRAEIAGHGNYWKGRGGRGKCPPAIGPPSVPLDPHSKGPAPRNAPRLTPNGRLRLGAFIWNAGATAA
ncbi:hypothetical protein DF186_15935, partial [Enterococcus hirae]